MYLLHKYSIRVRDDTFFCDLQSLMIQIAKRFDSLNAQMPLTNDHFKRLSVTYECPLNFSHQNW